MVVRRSKNLINLTQDVRNVLVWSFYITYVCSGYIAEIGHRYCTTKGCTTKSCTTKSCTTKGCTIKGSTTYGGGYPPPWVKNQKVCFLTFQTILIFDFSKGCTVQPKKQPKSNLYTPDSWKKI